MGVTAGTLRDSVLSVFRFYLLCLSVCFAMLHHLSSAAKAEILFVQTFCTL